MSQNEHDPASVQPADVSALGTRIPRPSGLASNGRRRFVLGGAAATTTVVTLSSRPALANHCTISGMLSGNLSRPHDVTCQGLTPGCWKTQPTWPGSYVVGPCNPITKKGGECSDYCIPTMSQLQDWIDNGKNQQEKDERAAIVNAYLAELNSNPGTQFTSVFPVATSVPGLTLMQALWHQDVPCPGSNISPLFSHAVAALFNALYFGKDVYGYDDGEVIAMVVSRWNSDPGGLLNDLVTLNEREGAGCPR